MLQTILLSVYLLAVMILLLFGIHKYSLLYLYWKYRNKNMTEPPDPDSWPAVTVQLPVYNERYVITRLIKAVAQLNYPISKLHIQVLDDSTDTTTQLARRLVKTLQKKGYHIEFHHRERRDGFKAGALNLGLENSKTDYLAIFDADFIPHTDFLKKTIPHLLQPQIGMVQTCWGHVNYNYSLLTRLQAMFLDGHFYIDQAARHRSGRFFNFNGTAGVWRRQAIEEAGGWETDTLTEDLDLSYRAQLAGWKFVFLQKVVTPAELPVQMSAFKSQQRRWAQGACQTGLKLLPRILKAPLPPVVQFEAIMHLGSNVAYFMMVLMAVLSFPMIHYQVAYDFKWLLQVHLILFVGATFSFLLQHLMALKASQSSLWPGVLYIPLMMALGIGISVNNSWALWDAIRGRQQTFTRTPKYRIEGRHDTWHSKQYRPPYSYFHWIEFSLGLYFTVLVIYLLWAGYYWLPPFLLLFLGGFFYVAFSSWLEFRRA